MVRCPSLRRRSRSSSHPRSPVGRWKGKGDKGKGDKGKGSRAPRASSYHDNMMASPRTPPEIMRHVQQSADEAASTAWESARSIGMGGGTDLYAAGVMRGFALAAAKGVGKGSSYGVAGGDYHGPGGGGGVGGGDYHGPGGGGPAISGAAGSGSGTGLPPMPCGLSPTPDQQWWPCHFLGQGWSDGHGGSCEGWAVIGSRGSKKTRWVCAHCARLLAA